VTATAGALANYRQLQGKELSFNNIADADAAWECVKSMGGFESAACVIVKHANPCGVASAPTRWKRTSALQTDPTSAFGGIIAFNVEVDGAAATELAKLFVEVLIAPSFTAEAKQILSAKQNVRLLEIPLGTASTPWTSSAWAAACWCSRQTRKRADLGPEGGHQAAADPAATAGPDVRLARGQVRQVECHRVLRNNMTLGVGAGQMSRIDSARIASIKAQNAGLSLENSVVASDAFFPFRDGLDVVVDAGAPA
jgi:phosphoribosylaminoimidazolecarboxamide formyltransferase/IMP cyclohydrolase